MPFGPGRYKRGEPEPVRGVYRYVDKNTNEIVYVGQSKNLRRRYQQHLRGDKPPFDPNTQHFDWKEQTFLSKVVSALMERQQKERDKIRQHNPPLNRNKGGGGRT